MRQFLSIAIIGAFSTSCTPAPPPPAVDCVAAWRQSSQPAIPALAEHLRQGRVVILGEHHGDAHELGVLTRLIAHAASAGVPFDLAMELVPEHADAELGALQTSWTEAGWARLIARRTFPEPFQHGALADPVRTALGAGVPVIGLAPDCGIPADPTDAQLDLAIECFSTRDAHMAAALVDRRTPGRGMLISAGLWHGAQRRPQADPSLAALLEAALKDDVLQVLISGAEGPDPAGPAGAPGTCLGLPAWLQNDADHDIFAMLNTPPWSSLPGSCVADGHGLSPRLSDLFDAIVAPAPTTGPRMGPLLPDTTWTHVPTARFAAWDRLQTTLMGRPSLGTDPAAWAKDLNARAAKRDGDIARPTDVCAVVERLSAPRVP